jgi:uncharacterized protein (DUF2141 family)
MCTTTINEPGCPTITSSFTAFAPTCAGGDDGYAALTATGGNGGYTFSYEGVDLPSDTLFGLTAGTYTITVTDANGCIQVDSIAITQPDLLVLENCRADSATTGLADGVIYTTPVGGVGPYLIRVADSEIVSEEAGQEISFTGLAAGVYTVSITDANNCTASCAVTVPETSTTDCPTITLAPLTSPGTCGRALGNIQLNPNGGTPGYAASWADTNVNTLTRDSLEAGTYFVTVSDANGCSVSDSITVENENVVIVASLTTTDINCGNVAGSIDLVHDSTATTTYEWSNNDTSQDLNGLNAGVYTVTITQDGCSLVLSDSITTSIPFSGEVQLFTPILCHGETAVVNVATIGTVAEPVSYNWSIPGVGNTQTIFAAPGGEHTVTITDGSGCSIVVPVVIEEPSPIELDAAIISAIGCDGPGSISLAVSGGAGDYEFTWSGNGTGEGAIRDNITEAGTYFVTITDANDCSRIDTFMIDQATTFSLGVSVSEGDCTTNTPTTLSLVVTGGIGSALIEWNTGENTETIIASVSGIYTAIVTEPGGCTDSISVEVTVPEAWGDFPEATVENVTCNEAGAIYLNISGDYTYRWNTEAGDTTDYIENLPSGEYQVTVTNTSGCDTSFIFSVEDEGGGFVASINAAALDLECPDDRDGEIIATNTGGVAPITYSWEDGSVDQFRTGLGAGTYWVDVTDGNGCVRSDTITLTAPEPPQIDSVAVSEAGCSADAGAIRVFGGPDQRYSIDGGVTWTDGLFTGLAPGRYDLLLGSLDYDCTFFFGALTVGEGDGSGGLLATTTVLPGGDCIGGAGGSILITPAFDSLEFALNSGPFAGETSFNDLTPGTYAVHVRNPFNGCPAQTDSVTVGVLPVLALDTASVVSPYCYGGADGEIAVIATGGSGNYSYNWSDAATAATRFDLPAGMFSVTVTDGTGCVDSLSVSLPEDAAMAEIDARVDNITVCSVNEVSISLDGINEGYTYSWTFPGGAMITGEEFSTGEAGEYQLLVDDGSGCTFLDTFTVSFLDNEGFAADLLMPTQGVIDTAITIINRTQPSPDSVVWHYDESLVTFLGGNGFLNNFSFAEPGIYEIGMDAYSGGCSASVFREIQIFETIDSLGLDGDVNFGQDLRGVEVWPIPHDGTFRLRGNAVRDVVATFYFFNENGVLLYQDQRNLTAGEIDEPFGQDGEAMDIVNFLPVGVQTVLVTTDVSVVSVRHVRGL